MQRNIMWSPWNLPGLEYLHLLLNDQEIVADSVIMGLSDVQPFRIHYKLLCDADWRVKELDLALLSDYSKNIQIRVDGQGKWTTMSGNSIASLEHCLDVDISATPFTNTLPIRRLGLRPGQSAELVVVYIAIPEMELKPERQRYTCLEWNAGGGVYKYEGLESGFSAELPVDSDGLVTDYPGLFKRVWPPARTG